MIAGGVYVTNQGYQPVCKGLDERDELVWELKPKENWHQKMFPVQYRGDFLSEWMEKSHTEKYGIFDEEDING